MFEQIKLDYKNEDLEPYIDTMTMDIHYNKHHKAYTDSLNDLVHNTGIEDMDIITLLKSVERIADEKIRDGIRNYGGGYYNHNLYFSILSPCGCRIPRGVLADKIDECFGSFDLMKVQLITLATEQFGSGWAWLSVSPGGTLVVSKTANQDNPISLGTGNTPIFTIDVWEHAYYLKHKNMRKDYIKDFFNLVDWRVVEENLLKAL